MNRPPLPYFAVAQRRSAATAMHAYDIEMTAENAVAEAFSAHDALRTLRVVHVLPAMSEEASGPSYSVVRLCEALRDAGEDVRLAALDWAPLPTVPRFVHLFPMGAGPRKLGRSPSMRDWLKARVSRGEVDVVHNHGMWQMNAVYPGAAVRGTRARLVVSPRGAFSDWAMKHGSPLKKVFWPLLQRPALAPAACFHATGEPEYAAIRRRGFEAPVAVLPNGIHVPEQAAAAGRTDTRTLLFLGRMHPVKGLDILLQAWTAVMKRFPEWRLKLVGDDRGWGRQGGYLDTLKALAQRLGAERVEFAGAAFGTQKLAAYREAELYVLPTHSENFGMTVAESLAAGTPAVVTRGAPWEGLAAQGAGWWIDTGVEPLVSCLEVALAASPEALRQRGENGRRWMLRDFSWDVIGHRMDVTYRWLLDGGPVPPWVRID
jgi:glycosyltransferase involved in cell wall biosynthesis